MKRRYEARTSEPPGMGISSDVLVAMSVGVALALLTLIAAKP